MKNLILISFLIIPPLLGYPDLQQDFDDVISKKELLGQFDPSSHPDFEKIHSDYTNKPSIYLRKKAYSAFKDMFYDAKLCGIDLKIISATRNFNYQKGIWERKWKRTKYMGWQKADKALDILKYSSMPGTSRHHWGTDIDLNDLNNSYFETGEGQIIYQWLRLHAKDYGFEQVYTSKDQGRTGYQEEKWHWSYLPLSSIYLQEYNRLITSEDINNFNGSEVAGEIQAIEKYVNGIQKENP